jgi:hypothetical protein
MGFSIQKSISAGPFRFNLSGSGVGMSVGVKGLRIGTGPRGNYVRMGRGGLYYRASLGTARHNPRIANSAVVPVAPSRPAMIVADGMTAIETGNISEMTPASGSSILQEINAKLALWPSWPWLLGGSLVLCTIVASVQGGPPFALALAILALVATAIAARWDAQRKMVVIMYDLDDNIIAPFKAFSEEFDRLARAGRIWNIDTAGRTGDWKRNAGASHLITRKIVQLSYDSPPGVKTNVALPSIVGGRQNIYFLPDVVLVIEGTRAGAISYEQLVVSWERTVFIEDDGVPRDSQVVGQTWKYVNKKGGPDRRFNNNKQIPKVLYQQMGIQGPGGLQKLLHISQVADRNGFDATLDRLGKLIRTLQQLPSPSSMQSLPIQPA